MGGLNLEKTRGSSLPSLVNLGHSFEVKIPGVPWKTKRTFVTEERFVLYLTKQSQNNGFCIM